MANCAWAIPASAKQLFWAGHRNGMQGITPPLPKFNIWIIWCIACKLWAMTWLRCVTGPLANRKHRWLCVPVGIVWKVFGTAVRKWVAWSICCEDVPTRPRNMTKTAGFYNTLMQSDEPALIIECLNGYRLKEQLPNNLGAFRTPIGVVETVKSGEHYLGFLRSTLRLVQEAARLLQVGIDAEVIDVQSLLPLDLNHDLVKASKRPTACWWLMKMFRWGIRLYFGPHP